MSERGSKIIHFRANDSELKCINKIQNKLNCNGDLPITVSKSKAIRVALHDELSTSISGEDMKQVRVLMDKLEQIRGILYRDGGNLNQIAHQLNSGDVLDQNVYGQLVNTENALKRAESELRRCES